MGHHDFLQTLEGGIFTIKSLHAWHSFTETHFEVQDVGKDVRTSLGHFLVRLDDVGKYHRVSAEVLPQQLRTLDAQLSESPWWMNTEQVHKLSTGELKMHSSSTLLPVIRIFGGLPLGVSCVL